MVRTGGRQADSLNFTIDNLHCDMTWAINNIRPAMQHC
ncbi:hypothetical protein yaldo0001_17640 [Yersinia aldovae ATCC 35236]|nr:hypothetical protein yaldo0001_17640 [Yersinia aldovae ATCC 35236]